jgi:ABC-type nitrate/sulfonate/bicarbonate transport system ATPase subunit
VTSPLVREISLAYGDAPVFTGVTVPAVPGILVIYGPSGSGKTTLLRIIAGLESGFTGERNVPADARFSMVFQDDLLLPWFSVRKNLYTVIKARGIPRGEADELIRESLRQVELTEKERDLPAELSGGMRRRVALARALLHEADYLLLDEPFTGLDLALRERLRALLVAFNEERGVPIIMTSHDPEDAARIASRVLVIAGRPARPVDAFSIPEGPDERSAFPGRMQRIYDRIVTAVRSLTSENGRPGPRCR